MAVQIASMAIPDWQLASFGAMIFLAAYAIAAKQFFNSNHDWRAFIPLILLAGVALTVYYLYTGAHSSIGTDSYLFALGLGVIFAFSSLFSFIAIKNGPVSVVVPLFSLNLIIVVIAGFLLLGEKMTTYKIAGVILGLVSIFLLSFESS